MSIAVSSDEKKSIFSYLQKRTSEYTDKEIVYLDLSFCIIRVICYSKEIRSLLLQQCAYVFSENEDHFDYTIVAWKEDELGELALDIAGLLSQKNRMHAKAEMLWIGASYPAFEIEDSNASFNRIGRIDGDANFLEIFDDENKTAYFSNHSFLFEDFVKEGHVFARVLSHLCGDKDTILTHGAVFGYDNKGLLVCGRGGSGKSTLTAESLLCGCEYVSDDYQILKKHGDVLLSYPIYSYISLSDNMYEAMKDRFSGEYICRNYTQDKNIFSIAGYHKQFRKAYPIKACLFPEITSEAINKENPSIRACSPYEKGRAIVQIIHSTLYQMSEMGNREAISKLLLMIQDLPFIKINLSSNISKNAKLLKDCVSSLDFEELRQEYSLANYLDISYGLATIIDKKGPGLVCMNKFASNVFALLLAKEPKAKLREKIRIFEKDNPKILEEFDKLVDLIENRGYDELSIEGKLFSDIREDYAKKSGYSLSVFEYVDNHIIELVKD